MAAVMPVSGLPAPPMSMELFATLENLLRLGTHDAPDSKSPLEIRLAPALSTWKV